MDNSTYPYNASFTSAELPCRAMKNWFAIGFMPLDSLSIILNLGLLIASMVERKRLQRQNYAMAVVNSALLSNVIHLTLNLWGASANIMARDSGYVLGITKTVWTVCESGAAAIGFCVVANASSVIYVVIDSTYVASRSGKDFSSKSRQLPAKKRISNALIIISWAVPVGFIAVATATWNCSAYCWCPSSSFEGEVCPHEYRCSRLITPLPISFLLINAALWAVEIVVLVIMIAKKYWEFRLSTLPDRSSCKSGVDIEGKRDSTPVENLDYQTDRFTSTPPVQTARRQNRAISSPRFRMAVILTVMLSICFVTRGVAIVIDAVNPEAVLRVPMMVSTACLFVYTVTFPFILTHYLPNLRNSMLRLGGKATRCCKTS